MGWRALLALYGLPGLISARTSRTNPVAPSSGVSTTSSVSTSVPSSAAPSFCVLNGDCCGPKTITSTDQLNALSSCHPFYGDLILKGVPIQAGYSTIDIPVSAIQNGSLEVSGVYSAISLNNLVTVSGDIFFTNVKNLQTSLFPNLTAAASINFESVEFNGPSTEFDRSATAIIWNSNASAPKLQSVQSITFNNTNVNVIGPFAMSTPDSESPNVYINGNKGLESVDLSGTDSLGTANISNNLLKSLDLSSVGTVNLLDITQNAGLDYLNFPALTTIDTLIVANNPKLQNITLSDLQHVTTSLYINGPINHLILPSTPINVTGNITVESSGGLECGSIRRITADGHPASCTNSPHAAPTSASSVAGSSSPTSSTSSSSSTPTHKSSGLSSGATIGIGVGVGLGGALVLALALFFCWRSRRSKDSHAIRSTPKERSGYSGKGDYYSYCEVPYEASGGGGAKQVREEPQSEEHTTSRLVGTGNAWVPPEPTAANTEGRTELEEQQGPRHEMDARSIDFSDDEDEAETRSLEDIERVHQQQ